MEYKLGKLPPVIDRRTIRLKSIIRTELLPPLSETFDNHEQYSIVDNFKFNNSKYGDCVIAARAHQTLVLEAFEQLKQIEILDGEVVNEYFEQSGGQDRGLVLLWSIRDWKNDGWLVGGKDYTIYAFASVDWKDHVEVKHCIHLLGGVNLGITLYREDMNQFTAHETWHLTDNSGEKVGGHGVYAFAYDDGITMMTWGRAQKATWDWWDARVDEAYGIVDNRNHWLPESPVDIHKLDGYLQEITEGRGEPKGCFALSWIMGLIKRII